MNILLRVSESALGNDRPRRTYYLTYTFVFCCTALFAFSWFIASGRTLIWQPDGWQQHYTALVWYGKYLRSIVMTLLHSHSLSLPDFDFAIGEGADVLATMHYYVMGEPLNLLSVFVPSEKMYLLYDGLILLRLYLAGLAFSYLCLETSRKNRFAILAGAISYVFCFWALLNAARHPYFLTPMIYFPLLILGVEKIITQGEWRQVEKPYLFPLTVALAAVSNFYFFYIQVLLTVGYCLLRAVDLYGRNLKQIFAAAIRVTIPAVIGVLVSGVVFIPIAYVFLSDTRMSMEHTWYFLYPWTYYSKLPSRLITTGNSFWLCIGVSVPVVFAVVLLLTRKDNARILRWLLAASVVVVLVPAFGQILNGMSYRANRWSFALSLLLCYIMTVKWQDMLQISEKEGCVLFTVLIVYWAGCMLMNSSRTLNTFSNMCLAFAVLGVLWMRYGTFERVLFRECLLVLLVIINVSTNSFWFYSDGGDRYAQQCVEVSKVRDEFMNNEAGALKDLVQEEYVRYSGNEAEYNSNVPHRVSAINYYWSLSNPNITEFRKALNLIDEYAFRFSGYDRRASLLALSATNYYLSAHNNPSLIPYGYSNVCTVDLQAERTHRFMEDLKEELGTDDLSEPQISTIEDRSASIRAIYKNSNSLPLGYCYDQYFTKEHWDRMSSIERQQAMLSAVYLSDNSSAGSESVPQETSLSVPYTVTCSGNEITYNDGKIITTESNANLTLEFNSPGDGETYLEITGLNFDGTDRYDLYFGDRTVDPQDLYNKTNWRMLSDKDRSAIRTSHYQYEDPTNVTLSFLTSDARWSALTHMTAEDSFYYDKHDYTLNLGYYEEPCTSVTITFPTPGVYSFDSLRVVNVPMADFSQKIDALREDALENIEFGTDTVRGTISLDTPKILCVAIPYSEGWAAEVDGETVPTLIANGQYIGLELPSGNHTVVLKYATPFKGMGLAATCTGLLFLAAYLYILQKRKQEAASH